MDVLLSQRTEFSRRAFRQRRRLSSRIGDNFGTLLSRDYHRAYAWWTLRPSLRARISSRQSFNCRNVPNLFARNERVVCIFDTGLAQGKSWLAQQLSGVDQLVRVPSLHLEEIVSTNGTIHRKESIGKTQESEEMGRFKLSSTVINLLPRMQYDSMTPYKMALRHKWEVTTHTSTRCKYS